MHALAPVNRDSGHDLTTTGSLGGGLLRRSVGISVRYRFMVAALAAVLLAFGAAGARHVAVDVFPEFSSPVVEIQTEAVGLAAAEVERLVTHPLEELLSGVSWLKTLRSDSVAGLSSIRMTFEPSTDLMRARQLVQERLTLSYTLPSVAKAPVMLQPLSATSRVMMIALFSDELSLVQQSVIAQWTIKPKLLGVPGVANVAIWGERKRQLQVQVDPDKLRQAGVKQERIVSTAGDSLYVASLSFLKASNPGTGGWIDGPNQRLEIRHVLPISSAEELGQVSVDGSKLRLHDVAKVVEGHPLLVGDALVNNKSGIMLVVEKFPGANTLEVTRRIEAALAVMRPGLPGLTIDHQAFRAAGFIEQAIENHEIALGAGLVLLTLALMLFFRDWRAVLVSLVSIVLSMAAAGVVLQIGGASLNTVVLAGLVLALAAVIDDVVIVVENILRRLREADGPVTQHARMALIGEAVIESRRTIGYATMILLLIIAPLLFMGGSTGAFIKPLALSYGVAIICAMLVAMIATPALAMLLLGRRVGGSAKSGIADWCQRRYDAMLVRVLGRPTRTLAVATVIGLGMLAVWPLLNRALLPEFRERDLVVRWEARPGTSHPEMLRITAQATREIRAIPGVRTVNAHIGRAVTGDQVVTMNSGQIWIGLNPGADHATTLAAVRTALDNYPGLERTVQSYLRERVREALTGVSSPIVVRLFGPEREVLTAKAEEVRQLLSRINGITDLRVQGQVVEPQVQVKVDLAAAAKHGLKPGDVRRSAAMLFSGLEVGKIFEQQKVYDVVVWSHPDSRSSVTGLANTQIETPAGGHVRLDEIAEIRVQSTPTVIRHERASPYVDVTADVRGRALGPVMVEIERRLADVNFPLEHHPELLGEHADQRTATIRMYAVAVASAIGIFLLLQALVGSWGLSAAMMIAMAGSVAGGVLAALVAGGELSLGSMVGFVAVLGLAVRQTTALVQRYQDLAASGSVKRGTALIERGSHERLVPVLTSALAVAMIALPFVVLGSAEGFEIEHPMAIVILGGLVTSTLFVLLVVPAAYALYGERLNPDPSKGAS